MGADKRPGGRDGLGAAGRTPRAEKGELRELFLLFTKLGFVAFGGPAAHVAMMREEVVTRRGWMGDQEFLDLNGATNLIPGPNSTELAIHIGRDRAGWRGLLVAGTCFIMPAALIVLVLAVLYARYGSTPAGRGLLYGITPVVIAIVAQALWGLLKTAIKGWTTAVVGAGACEQRNRARGVRAAARPSRNGRPSRPAGRSSSCAQPLSSLAWSSLARIISAEG